MTSAIQNQPTGVLPEQNAKAGQVQDASTDAATRTAAAEKTASTPKDTVSISTEARAKHAETQASTSVASTTSAASSSAEAAVSAGSGITSTKIDNLTKEIEALKKDMNGTGGEERVEMDKKLKQKEAELKRLQDQAAAS